MVDAREALIFKAKVAEETERFEDMVTFMKDAIKNSNMSLTVEQKNEQRNLLSVAYKNIIGVKRSSWRIAYATLVKKMSEKAEDYQIDFIKSYKAQIEKELQDVVDDVIGLLDECILKKLDESKEEEEADEKAFYYKMKGDYCRYNAEFLEGEENKERREKVVECASSAYEKACETATKNLSPTSPIRLGLILNYSVFFYEIAKNKDQACKLAKEAFDDAIAELDSLNESSYKDSTLIMQLLRDNLTLWSTETETDEAQQ